MHLQRSGMNLNKRWLGVIIVSLLALNIVSFVQNWRWVMAAIPFAVLFIAISKGKA